jgi:hypothetical protein
MAWEEFNDKWWRRIPVAKVLPSLFVQRVRAKILRGAKVNYLALVGTVGGLLIKGVPYLDI